MPQARPPMRVLRAHQLSRLLDRPRELAGSVAAGAGQTDDTIAILREVDGQLLADATAGAGDKRRGRAQDSRTIAGAIKGLTRYVQCHTLPATYGTSEPPYDGCAQLWWDTLERMRDDTESSEVQAALADERNFIDHSRVATFVSEETVIDQSEGRWGFSTNRGVSRGMKLIVCLKRKEDMTPRAFKDYLSSTNQRLTEQIPGLVNARAA